MEIQFTDRELDIMAILWERGSGTVNELRRWIADELAYTSVLSVLQTLEEKGYVTHTREGKAYRYRPAVERFAARESALQKLVTKLFGGSSTLLLTHLISEEDLPLEDLQRLHRLLEDRVQEARGG